MILSGIVVGFEKGNIETAVLEDKVCAIRIFDGNVDCYKIILKGTQAEKFWTIRKSSKGMMNITTRVSMRELRKHEVVFNCNNLLSVSSYETR